MLKSDSLILDLFPGEIQRQAVLEFFFEGLGPVDMNHRDDMIEDGSNDFFT